MLEAFHSTKDAFLSGLAPSASAASTAAPPAPPSIPAAAARQPPLSQSAQVPVEVEWEEDTPHTSEAAPKTTVASPSIPPGRASDPAAQAPLEVEWEEDSAGCVAPASAGLRALVVGERVGGGCTASKGVVDAMAEPEAAPDPAPSLLMPAAAEKQAEPYQFSGLLLVRKSRQKPGRVSIDFGRSDAMLASLDTPIALSPVCEMRLGPDAGPAPSHAAPAVVSQAAEQKAPHQFFGSLAIRKSTRTPGRVSLDLRRPFLGDPEPDPSKVIVTVSGALLSTDSEIGQA